MFEIIAFDLCEEMWLSEKFGTCLSAEGVYSVLLMKVCRLGMFHLIFLSVYLVWGLGGAPGMSASAERTDLWPYSKPKAVSQSHRTAKQPVCLFSFIFCENLKGRTPGKYA